MELIGFLLITLVFAALVGALWFLLGRARRNEGEMHGSNSELRHIHPPHGLG